MKKVYKAPSIETTYLESQDVLANSLAGTDNYQEDREWEKGISDIGNGFSH